MGCRLRPVRLGFKPATSYSPAAMDPPPRPPFNDAVKEPVATRFCVTARLLQVTCSEVFK